MICKKNHILYHGAVDGTMTAEMALGKLVKEELKHQVCVSNQLIIDQYFTFQESVQL